MDNRDAKKVVQELSSKPFVCGKKFIEIDGGYVITTKEHFMHLESKAAGLIEPVQHGQWEKIWGGDYLCSLCHSIFSDDGSYKYVPNCFKYCPNCGAKMNGR